MESMASNKAEANRHVTEARITEKNDTQPSVMGEVGSIDAIKKLPVEDCVSVKTESSIGNKAIKVNEGAKHQLSTLGTDAANNSQHIPRIMPYVADQLNNMPSVSKALDTGCVYELLKQYNATISEVFSIKDDLESGDFKLFGKLSDGHVVYINGWTRWGGSASVEERKFSIKVSPGWDSLLESNGLQTLISFKENLKTDASNSEAFKNYFQGCETDGNQLRSKLIGMMALQKK